MQNKLELLLMAFMMAFMIIIAGCDSSAPASQPVPTTPPKAVEQPQPGTGNPGSEQTMLLTVYHATKDAMYLVPETHKVPVNSHPARTAIELLLAGTKNPELVNVIPPGTKLKNLTIKDHIAYVDFDDKLVKKNTGGSASELLLVGAIVNTLTEFPDIHQVQIMVEGKKIGTISGHVDTSEPLSRSEQVIKK
ncbi:hypothetical protein SCACP_09330 [Sporomusa carbonis]|uniref:GerMN domain-containing protein n=1 Tax=Sporomusa carbonis TaxID=3076075 RepID=UPI003A779C0A